MNSAVYIFTHWWESINPEMCAVLYIRTWMNSKPCIQKCAAKGIPLFKLYFFAYNITMKSLKKCLIWSGMDKFIAKEYCIFPVQSQTTILKKLYNQRKWGKFLIFGSHASRKQSGVLLLPVLVQTRWSALFIGGYCPLHKLLNQHW